MIFSNPTRQEKEKENKITITIKELMGKQEEEKELKQKEVI